MDEPTALLSRPSVAIVCIEVDVSKPLNHRLWMGDEKDGYWQDVVFENPPLYCGFCKALDHEDKCCYFKNPSLRTVQDKQSKENEHPVSSDDKPPKPLVSSAVVVKDAVDVTEIPSSPQRSSAVEKVSRDGRASAADLKKMQRKEKKAAEAQLVTVVEREEHKSTAVLAPGACPSEKRVLNRKPASLPLRRLG